MAFTQYPHPGGHQGEINDATEQIMAIIQAVAQGQDISNFDPRMLSAAKQHTATKANELNKMINSSSLPPNVTRETLRNELQMYEGFTNKLAEDDPQFANAMDIAFVGAGLYAAYKYGPMAAAKAKTVGAATYGYGQEAYGKAAGAVSGAGQSAGAAVQRGVGAAADFASRGSEYFQNRGAFPGVKPYSPTYGYAQKAAGYGKQAMGALSKGVRRMFKIPV